MKSLLAPLLLVLVVFGLSAEGRAQAALEVVLVQPDDGAAIAYVPLILRNDALGFEEARTTNEQGKVRFAGLPTGGVFRVSLGGQLYQLLAPVEALVLVDGKTTSLTLEATTTTVSLAAVSVTAYEPQVVNATDAEVASELSLRELSELPVEGRDITRALFRLPNISPATGFFPESPTVSINGANSLYVNYQIDGMDNNENFLGGQRFNVPIGFTRHITALTNNFGAEHGLTSNGIINITTPSGTNTWAGEVFYQTRPGPVIDGASPYAQRDLSGNLVQDGFMRHQGGFAVGGPLKRNKTFLYLNVEHTADIKDNLLTLPQQGLSLEIPGSNRFTYASAKLDQVWSSRWRSSWRVNVGAVGIERQGGGLDGGFLYPSAGNTQVRNSLNAAWKNAYTTEKFTWEANYQFAAFRWNYADPAEVGLPQVTVLDPFGETVAILGHPGYVFEEHENSHTLQQRFSLDAGNHTLKFGGQLRFSQFDLFGGGNPNGNYRVRLTEPQLIGFASFGAGALPSDLPAAAEVLDYGVELRPTAFGQNQAITSVWLEDQWAATDKLNLSLGLRYDVDNLSRGGGEDLDLNNLGPRVSANYRLDNRSSIRVGYGIYYDKILYAVVSDALQFNTTGADYQGQLQALIDQGILPQNTDLDAVTNEGNLTANVANVPYLQGPSAEDLQDVRDAAFSNERRILNPNGYQNPFAHQMMVGYQRRLSEKSLIYIDLLHNRSHKLFRLRDLNAPAAYGIDPDNVVVRTQAEADATRPVPIYTDAQGAYALVGGDTLRGVSRNVMVTESAGRSNYWAANLTWQKVRADDNWAFRLVYTLSFLENNTEDINFRAMDANDFESEWGPSINDRTHLLNGIVNWYPVNNLAITLAALLQSGQPINRVPDASLYGTTDLNGDGRSFGDAYVGNSDRAPGESRNSDRLPWATTFDASVFYDIPLSRNPENDAFLQVGASVFNMLNADNLSGYANNATQSNQVQPGPASSGVLIRRNAAPPRQFQFSLRYVFGS